MKFDFEMEYKLDRANLVVVTQEELASITNLSFSLVDKIKEGLEHDPQAKDLMEFAKQGKTCQV